MMTTETGTLTGTGKKAVGVRQLVQIAALSAVAAILMYLEIPLPFLAPDFYELDFSEVPVMVGTMAMGPAAGVSIELVKILLKLVLKGTQTMFVGELGNFIVGCALVLPAGLIYKWKRTRKSALIGMLTGTVIMAFIGAFVNAYLLLPAYAKAFHADLSAFVAMGAAIHSSIDSVLDFAALIVVPFNLFKGVMVSMITFLIYKRIRPLIK